MYFKCQKNVWMIQYLNGATSHRVEGAYTNQSYWRKTETESVCVCVWERERDMSDCAIEYARAGDRESVCVRERKYERMKDRNCKCASEYKREREIGCVWTRVCERVRISEKNS